MELTVPSTAPIKAEYKSANGYRVEYTVRPVGPNDLEAASGDVASFDATVGLRCIVSLDRIELTEKDSAGVETVTEYETLRAIDGEPVPRTDRRAIPLLCRLLPWLALDAGRRAAESLIKLQAERGNSAPASESK